MSVSVSVSMSAPWNASFIVKSGGINSVKEVSLKPTGMHERLFSVQCTREVKIVCGTVIV